MRTKSITAAFLLVSFSASIASAGELSTTENGIEKELIFIPLTNRSAIGSATTEGPKDAKSDQIPDAQTIKEGSASVKDALQRIKKLSDDAQSIEAAVNLTEKLRVSITELMSPVGPVFKFGIKVANLFKGKDLMPEHETKLASSKDDLMKIKNDFSEIQKQYKAIDKKTSEFKEDKDFPYDLANEISQQNDKVDSVYQDFLNVLQYSSSDEVEKVQRTCAGNEITGTTDWINREVLKKQKGSFYGELKGTTDLHELDSMVVRLVSLATHALIADYVCSNLPASEYAVPVTLDYVDKIGQVAVNNLTALLKRQHQCQSCKPITCPKEDALDEFNRATKETRDAELIRQIATRLELDYPESSFRVGVFTNQSDYYFLPGENAFSQTVDNKKVLVVVVVPRENETASSNVSAETFKDMRDAASGYDLSLVLDPAKNQSKCEAIVQKIKEYRDKKTGNKANFIGCIANSNADTVPWPFKEEKLEASVIFKKEGAKDPNEGEVGVYRLIIS